MSEKEEKKFYCRYNTAKSRADLWRPLLRACFYYAVPFRDRFYRPTQAQGELNNKYLYDSTGVEATKSFVSNLHSSMTPPQVQWGYLVGNDDELSEDEMALVNEGLQKYMKKLFMYLHRSNFDVVVGESYYDLGVGTSCIVVNQSPDLHCPILYTSIPIDQLAIEESVDGKVHSWFRLWPNMRANEIESRWPKAELPRTIKSELKINPELILESVVEGVVYDPSNTAYPYTYALYADMCKNEPIFSIPMKYNPGVVWRFQKTNNEWWGRGPVMDALPAMIRANQMGRIDFASANLNVFKPMMAFSDSVFNPFTFELKPGTTIPIAPLSRDGQIPLIPLPNTADPNFAQMTVMDLRNQINKLLYSDPLGPVEAPSRTATEAAIRQQNLAEKVGPIFTRMQQEFLWPIIYATMEALDNSGVLPRPEINGRKLTFEYKSPLSLLKAQQDLNNFAQYIQILQGVFGPDVAQLLVNQGKAPWLLASSLQIDLELLATPQQVAQAAQQMAQERQAMMQQQQQQGAQ